jgi:WD40 repeat protein
VAFSPADGLLAASGLDAALCLWRPDSRSTPLPDPWRREDSRSGALAFARDGTLALAGRDAIIRLGRLTTGAEEVARFTGHQTRINALAFTPDGKSLLSASDDGTVLIWKVPRRGR